MENITFASFIEKSARSRTRFERDSQSGPAFQKFSPMGTRIRFLGWYRTGIGHPPFSTHPSMTATIIGHAKGPGPASLNSGYGSRKRSIDSGVPLGKGRGCFGGPVGVRNGTRQRGEQQSTRGILGLERRRPGISRAELIQHVADLGGVRGRSCRTLATEPRSLYQC
jgi:hypothetical protein